MFYIMDTFSLMVLYVFAEKIVSLRYGLKTLI